MTFTYEQMAQICHEANRAIQRIEGDPTPSVAWDETSPYERETAVEGIRNALSLINPERLHEMWCEAKVRDGWTLGKIKDPVMRTHPCLVPYADLPYTQRAKDAIFMAIVETCVKVPE